MHGPPGPTDQRGILLGGGKMRFDQDMRVAVISGVVRVANRAHPQLLAHLGVAHQGVAGVPVPGAYDG